VGSDYINMDKYLLDIVRDRKYWENKRYDIHQKQKRLDAIIEDYTARIDELKQEQRRIIKEAKTEAQDIISQSNAQVERTIKEIREVQAHKEKTKEVRSQLIHEQHVFTGCAGTNILRILPPLIITKADVDDFIFRLENVLKTIHS
jgi:acetylornithine/succinyldiaminopimelate/putrescine aminotransferase